MGCSTHTRTHFTKHCLLLCSNLCYLFCCSCSPCSYRYQTLAIIASSVAVKVPAPVDAFFRLLLSCCYCAGPAPSVYCCSCFCNLSSSILFLLFVMLLSCSVCCCKSPKALLTHLSMMEAVKPTKN